jgi:hypothetical protein
MVDQEPEGTAGPVALKQMVANFAAFVIGDFSESAATLRAPGTRR